MAESREKRNSKLGAALAIADQVGGRQAQSSVAGRGGGYQGSCTTSMSRLDQAANGEDPRFAELERMGLRAVHLRVARAIGVDAFLKVWQIYDADAGCRTEKGDLEIVMRSFRSYLRYQRNRFIEALVAEGKSAKEIRARVREDLSESLHPRHISRIARGK